MVCGATTCSLNPDTAALLPRLAALRRLVVDANGADDAALHHIAVLPQLRWVGGAQRRAEYMF
jgi:hypothetical protein